jgi:hypothetical protein
MRPALVAFSLLVPASLVAAILAACSAQPSTDDIRVNGPSGPNVADFTAACQPLEGGTAQSCGVSAMLERRCGSLDCHGFAGRAMRIYSKNGLRLPPIDPVADGGVVNEPGLGETTPEEKSANYRSVVGIEPEKTEDVAKGNAGADTLLIYKKPLGIEGHKGGVPVNRGDPSERCLVSWLSGNTDKILCGKAAELP